jgi:tetratricopeptide (TPR) repeat protein
MRNTVWQDEQAIWEDAALKSPGAPEPFIRLGTMHHDAGQRAIDESAQLARNDRRPAAMAQREVAISELGKAMSFLQQAVEMKPDDARLRATLGNTLAVINKQDEAIAMLTEALRLDPSLQDCTLQLGSLYAADPADPVNTEGKQKALDYFERAARLGPLKPEAAANYSVMLARAGNVGGAAQVIAPYASSAEPNSAPAAVLQQLKPLVEAARNIEQKAQEAEKTNPGTPETIKLRVQALLANGQNLAAFYQLERYLQLHPDDAEAWLMMGTTRARVDGPDAFVKEFASPPAIKEGDTPLWTQLVRRCAEQGRWSAARAYLEFAATQSDAFAKPLLRLGELAIELKQPAVAATMLDEAAKADDKDPAPWLLLSDIAIEAKSLPLARRSLDEAERRGADPAAVAPRREKAGTTPEEEKQKPRTILQ